MLAVRDLRGISCVYAPRDQLLQVFSIIIRSTKKHRRHSMFKFSDFAT